MNYRRFQPADFAQLYAIERACFQPPLRFPRAYMRELVSSPHAATWVAEENGELRGFAIVKILQEPAGQVAKSMAYIETLEVAAAWRKQGIGERLMRHLEESARSAGVGSIWLHVDVENAPAIRLYEAHGYGPQGSEPDYYANRRAAFIYAKPLSNVNGETETSKT